MVEKACAIAIVLMITAVILYALWSAANPPGSRPGVHVLPIVSAPPDVLPPSAAIAPRPTCHTSAEAVVTNYLMHAPEQGDWPWEEHCNGLASGVLAALDAHGFRVTNTD